MDRRASVEEKKRWNEHDKQQYSESQSSETRKRAVSNNTSNNFED